MTSAELRSRSRCLGGIGSRQTGGTRCGSSDRTESRVARNFGAVSCYEAETTDLLREIKERADAGDLAWLRRHSKVYEAIGAA